MGIEVAGSAAKLGRNGTASSHSSCRSSRSTNTCISLPSRVGEAGCPCVRASMGIPSHWVASSPSRRTVCSSTGRIWVCMHSFSNSGMAVLLTSCEVRPK